jgi:SAM-dependent methyltransferase
MEHTDWFENWFGSAYYKILYRNRNEEEASAFVEKLLAYLKPKPESEMLDIACGEGRYAVQLAEHGFEVTGIDLNVCNIDEAKKEEQNNLHFFVQDMRFPFYINYFDYAFNFFTSFGYFAHNRDHLLAAKSFAAGLKKGGILVIDYMNMEYSLSRMKPEMTIEQEGYKFHITKKVEHKHIIKDIEFTDELGTPRHYEESVATFTLEDFEHMFKIAGLTLTDTFGDYQLSEYNRLYSPRMIMVFKK